MAELTYVLCAATSTVCASLLIRGYRRRRTALLLWASFCFALIAVSNLLLVADMMIVPGTDLAALRGLASVTGMALLVYGLVWEVD